MPVERSVDHDVKAAIFVATGDASDRELRAARTDGPVLPPGYGELIDLRAAARFAVSPESMSMLIRDESPKSAIPTRVAIVSAESGHDRDDQPFELVGGLLSYALTRERPQSEIKIFRDVTEARGWLAAGLAVTSRPTTQMPAIGVARDGATTTLQAVVEAFAPGVAAADALRPQAVNPRTKEPVQPGIGPLLEAQAVRLVVAQMAHLQPHRFAGRLATEVPYPSVPRSNCDFCVGAQPHWEWAIEVQMLRFLGDDGTVNDNTLLHLLSPYPTHRSALTDCANLLASGFGCRKAIMIYGFDHDEWLLDPAIDAFEQLASARVRLSERASASFDELAHPVYSRGRVFAWEIGERSR